MLEIFIKSLFVFSSGGTDSHGRIFDSLAKRRAEFWRPIKQAVYASRNHRRTVVYRDPCGPFDYCMYGIFYLNLVCTCRSIENFTFMKQTKSKFNSRICFTNKIFEIDETSGFSSSMRLCSSKNWYYNRRFIGLP